MNLNDYRVKLNAVLQDDAQLLSSSEKDLFINEAVRTYSADRPRKQVHEITGDGAAYDFQLPNDWETGFSQVLEVEYPAGEQEPVYLDDNDWTVYQSISGEVFRFLSEVPGNGEKALLTYTVSHTLTASTSTIPDSDMDAVVNLAGALCCFALSRKLNQTMDATLEADSVNLWRQASHYERKGNRLLELYTAHLEGRRVTAPATVSGSYRVLPSWGNWRLTQR